MGRHLLQLAICAPAPAVLLRKKQGWRRISLVLIIYMSSYFTTLSVRYQSYLRLRLTYAQSVKEAFSEVSSITAYFVTWGVKKKEKENRLTPQTCGKARRVRGAEIVNLIKHRFPKLTNSCEGCTQTRKTTDSHCSTTTTLPLLLCVWARGGVWVRIPVCDVLYHKDIAW